MNAVFLFLLENLTSRHLSYRFGNCGFNNGKRAGIGVAATCLKVRRTTALRVNLTFHSLSHSIGGSRIFVRDPSSWL